MLAGIVVSLAAALAAFVLALPARRDAHSGADGARRAVLYLAVFPIALFLQAVYSESLFLVLALARVPARRARPLAGAGAGDGAGAC